jgi:hypothetical protein
LLAEDRQQGGEERRKEADVQHALDDDYDQPVIRRELRLYFDNECRANGREETRLKEKILMQVR